MLMLSEAQPKNALVNPTPPQIWKQVQTFKRERSIAYKSERDGGNFTFFLQFYHFQASPNPRANVCSCFLLMATFWKFPCRSESQFSTFVSPTF
jgi:hypothetical protein